MASHKITAVNPQTKTYESKFGPMVSYEVMFEDLPGQAVQVSQKPTTPAPAVNDVLEGSIDMSGQYGPKFKKDFQAAGGFTRPTGAPVQTATSGKTGSKFESDPFTMYLSYAKDLFVARVAAGLEKGEYASQLEDILTGGKVLHGGRPGAEMPNGPEQTKLDTILEVDMNDQPLIPEDELPWGN